MAAIAAAIGPIRSARLIDLEATLNWQFNGNIGALPPFAASGNRTASESIWDAIIGVKGKLSFGADLKWFVPYYLDIGT